MTNPINGDNREAIKRRFGLLPETCQEALLVAAAIGVEFRVETVSAVCKRRVDQVRDALDRQVDSGLVRAVADGDGLYRFTDSSIRELLYEEVPPARRPWLDRQIAESLARTR